MKIKNLKKIGRRILKKKFSAYILLLSILIAYGAGILSFFALEKAVFKGKEEVITEQGVNLSKIQSKVLPDKGYRIRVNWQEQGKKLIDDGVIDKKKLAQAISGTDELAPELNKYLDGSRQREIIVNHETARFWVDVLWGLGLANKNPILESGPMVEGGNTANFASTGGYTLGIQQPMDYYDKFSYIQLSPDQQKLVKEIADGVFRPCCGNSTSFPDCNHGMAALALIELLASQGKSKSEIYRGVLAFNSYWFPQTYLDIAYHFEKNGMNYSSQDPSKILSKTFSSAMGYQTIKRQIGDIAWPALQGAGGSCGA